jgi:hypothetical protein
VQAAAHRRRRSLINNLGMPQMDGIALAARNARDRTRPLVRGFPEPTTAQDAVPGKRDSSEGLLSEMATTMLFSGSTQLLDLTPSVVPREHRPERSQHFLRVVARSSLQTPIDGGT